MQGQISSHVIVIGGGLSGLTAAREILLKSPQTKVTVLEANDYLGGRTKSIQLDDCLFDLGAQFIGPTQQHVIDLAIQSKNQLIPINDQGQKVIDLKEGYFTYGGDIPWIGSIWGLVQMQLVIMKINRMATRVPLNNPRNCPLGYKWDSMTAQTWVQQNMSSVKSRAMLEGALRVILGVQLSEISFLYMLYYIHQSHNFQNLITVTNGLQQKKTQKGTQHMSLFLGDKIKQKGGDIRLNFMVKNIFQNSQGLKVTSKQGQIINGTHLIMAMPPPNLNKITFSPPLSYQRQLINQRSFMGNIAKVLVLYPQAFWKKTGFSGEALSDCFDGPAMNVFDNTHINQKGKQQPCLIVFIGGWLYRFWKDRSDFSKTLTQKLASYFKEPKMLHPTKIHWHRWEDQTVMGGPVVNYPPGILSQIDDIRKPEGRIHWAGTEMATVSTGYMDGAIESGKRAAKEIVSLLSEESPQNIIESEDKVFPYTRFTRPPKIGWMNRIFEWW